MAKIKRTLHNTTKPTYSALKKRHVDMGFDENLVLSREKFNKIILKPCVYCGFQPDGKTSWNSIDRIDSWKGYEDDNVVSACKHCNYTKGSLSVEQLKEYFERVYSFISERGLDNWPAYDEKSKN